MKLIYTLQKKTLSLCMKIEAGKSAIARGAILKKVKGEI